jgi:hypothetical protein
MSQKRIITKESGDKLVGVAKAKTTLATLITTQTADPSKVKVVDLMDRVRQLEIILGY